MRQVVLDTETTGLEPSEGHRVIEIGCIELIDRRLTRGNFHQYLQPDRSIDVGAANVHGITDEFLVGQPRFGDIAERFLEYIAGAQLIIHNAAFDLGFLNYELRRWREETPSIESQCEVIDTLELARARHPGQRNSLDALCKRYNVDNARRDLHGALLDAELLAEVYLAMTGGQGTLAFDTRKDRTEGGSRVQVMRARLGERPPLQVVRANPAELAAHQRCLAAIDKASAGRCLWRVGDGS